MAGIVRLAGFPPFVMLGLGGIWAEALADRAFRPAPLSRPGALAMMDDLRSARILEDLRGTGGVDREALAELLVRLGALALGHPRIREIDLNPILVAGGEPVVVDALMILGEIA